MRPHSDYVLVGRRAALTCDFATMLDDLRSALQRLDRQADETAQSGFGRSGHRFAQGKRDR
jgi:ribonuclease P protein component